MHRLGGVGIAAFERNEQSKRSFAELSSAVSHSQVADLKSQLDHFRTALARFATQHRETIKSDPDFRHAFQQMCATVGIDPLAGPRRGGWWAELLGLGDWQYELGVQIVDVCVSTRARNGGMIDMDELVRHVTRLRGLNAGAVTEEDIVSSIKTLAPLGAGYQELDQDQAAILDLAHDTGGRVVEGDLVSRRGWTQEQYALRDGLCWLDDQDPTSGNAYWIMSSMRWE
ncbi:EAP30/Vps36 family-domain-containing protein [Schizophyllum amplum]|uniref:EAP30/Vps36 family-domain-containing protein n=1 Tax=Schizophyllum amplum TaxID=97359 RepID=A0A550CA70_9AGAR|nr:EAP30/Vps36 family-domain-containing protein [Auriculariopsis ampla]